MYTLKGLFPEPKRENQKNFIKENVRQLKSGPNRGSREPKFTVNRSYSPKAKLTGSGSSMAQVKGSPSKKSNKVGKKNFVQIKKGDMAEFLRRKETRKQKVQECQESDEESSTSSGRLRDIACQTMESNFANQDTILTLLYPKEEDGKLKASGDTGRKVNASKTITPRRSADTNLLDPEKRSRVTAILERKDNNRDPYLPSGYQKGVLPKYLRERKEQSLKEMENLKVEGDEAVCPLGHVTLPDNERKETLRMLRNSFAEFVNELNKLPVKTDTLKMRNRKMELEKQLAKLEEGIKVFSRQKVFVKVGE